MSPPLFRLHQADLGYPSRLVLGGVDLTLAAGDFLVIGGPNGGGKSTLLRSLSGLIPLRAGRLEKNGTRIGYVPQQAAVESALPLTALEVCELGASAASPWWRALGGRYRAACRTALAQCQAADMQRRRFDQLSGGQRQRVLLARALATTPNCLLLDEPTAGVDRPTQATIASLLGSLHHSLGLGIVLVTHEFGPFQSVATRFLWVQDGLAAEASAADFVGRQGNLDHSLTR